MSDGGEDASCDDASELSEGEFAAYGALGGGDDGASYEEREGPSRGGRRSSQHVDAHGARCGAETLSPAALEEARVRDTFLVSHVRDGLSLETAKELLVRHRWDVHRLLRAEEGPEAGGRTTLPYDDTALRCPVCRDALHDDDSSCAAGAHADAPSEALLFFTGCAAGPQAHAGHAACLAALAEAAIAHAAAGEAHRPGTVPCPRCVADGVAAPGALTEAQVAALVTPEALALYRKARHRICASMSAPGAAQRLAGARPNADRDGRNAGAACPGACQPPRPRRKAQLSPGRPVGFAAWCRGRRRCTPAFRFALGLFALTRASYSLPYLNCHRRFAARFCHATSGIARRRGATTLCRCLAAQQLQPLPPRPPCSAPAASASASPVAAPSTRPPPAPPRAPGRACARALPRPRREKPLLRGTPLTPRARRPCWRKRRSGNRRA